MCTPENKTEICISQSNHCGLENLEKAYINIYPWWRKYYSQSDPNDLPFRGYGNLEWKKTFELINK